MGLYAHLQEPDSVELEQIHGANLLPFVFPGDGIAFLNLADEDSPGARFGEFQDEGRLASSAFPASIDYCGCLREIQNAGLGKHDDRPSLCEFALDTRAIQELGRCRR